MKNIRLGTKLRCIRDKAHAHHLTVGKIYRVTFLRSDQCFIRCDVDEKREELEGRGTHPVYPGEIGTNYEVVNNTINKDTRLI